MEPLNITDAAKRRCEQLFQKEPFGLRDTDPEFMERFFNFVFDEVPKQGKLEDNTCMMAILAALLGCQGTEVYREMLPAALDAGVQPAAVKEMVYQSVAYLGFGRALPFFHVTNDVLRARGLTLPLTGQATTTVETRLEAGVQAQVDIFGTHMRTFFQSGSEEIRHINRWLAGNCFGDYYTRTGLNLRQREMVTFCFLAAQGGCEPQLTSHAAANMRIGNSKAFLICVISRCLALYWLPQNA